MDLASGIAVDPSGNIFLSGFTSSCGAGNGLAIDPFDNVYIAGEKDNDMLLIKFSFASEGDGEGGDDDTDDDGKSPAISFGLFYLIIFGIKISCYFFRIILSNHFWNNNIIPLR